MVTRCLAKLDVFFKKRPALVAASKQLRIKEQIFQV